MGEVAQFGDFSHGANHARGADADRSGNKKLALAFERAWNARVGPGAAVWSGSPEGTGILTAQRGDDPFALTTQIRTLWR